MLRTHDVASLPENGGFFRVKELMDYVSLASSSFASALRLLSLRCIVTRLTALTPVTILVPVAVI